MTPKNLIIGILVCLITISISFIAELRAEAGQLTDNQTVCDVSDNSKFKILAENACAILSGDLRGRYHVFDAGKSAGSEIDFRGRVGVEAIREADSGVARVFVRLSLDSNGVSVDDAFAEYGGLTLGKVDSFGNLTYGNYALNSNIGLYHVDNSVAAIGYKLFAPLGTSIQLSVERPTENVLIPDLSGALKLDQNWGKIAFIGGGIALHSEGKKYQNPEYVPPHNKKDVDLTGIGYYGGAGVELRIPRLSSTKLGFTGFYADGALSKLNGTLLNNFDLEPSVPSLRVNQTEGAKNKGSQNVVQSKRFTKIVEELNKSNENYYVREISQSMEVDNPENELIKNNGIAANIGLTHSIGSNFKFHANGGWFIGTVPSYAMDDPDGKLTSTGTYLSTSLDFIPLENLTISLGFEHLAVKFGYEGNDEEFTKIYQEDKDGYFSPDPEIATTISITQSF